MGFQWKKPVGFYVNSVAISNDGQRIVAGSYYFPYKLEGGKLPPKQDTAGTFGTYCFDPAGTLLWKDEYAGNEGIYSVAVSGDGRYVAAGGILVGGKIPTDPSKPSQGLVRAYTADGRMLFSYSDVNVLRSRVNSVSFSHDGLVLAAATIDGQLLVWAGSTLLPATPVVAATGERLDMVSVHSSGAWLVAAGHKGTVHFVTIKNGAVDKVITWREPQAPEFLACAVAPLGDKFLVGGQNTLVLFDVGSITTPAGPQPLHTFTTRPGGTKNDIRWLALSGDGSLATVVQNLGNDDVGHLFTFTTAGSRLQLKRKRQLVDHNPNSTSIDHAGQFITVADGHPVGAPGTFYVFRASDGTLVLKHEIAEMNWPMVIAANGHAAVAGSDDGHVYFFTVP